MWLRDHIMWTEGRSAYETTLFVLTECKTWRKTRRKADSMTVRQRLKQTQQNGLEWWAAKSRQQQRMPNCAVTTTVMMMASVARRRQPNCLRYWRRCAAAEGKDCDWCGRHVRCQTTNDQSIAVRPKRQSRCADGACDISRRRKRAASDTKSSHRRKISSSSSALPWCCTVFVLYRVFSDGQKLTKSCQLIV